MLDAGADVITLGNHTWTRYELQPYLEQKKRILRPANFAPQCPGRGWGEYSVRGGPICVINLMGRFTLDANTDNPFLVADDILDQTQAKIVLVDMHAEATSEKRAMGFYLDGRVTAVWGTHTHVQTSDAEVLPEDKAAFIRAEHEKGRKVIMIGDGVNDSPALSEADAGIAMSDGAAIAREIADVTICSDDLESLVTLKRISDGLMQRIHANYRFIISFNTGLIVLGVAGVLPPSTSALLHNISTLGIGLRSMRNLLP